MTQVESNLYGRMRATLFTFWTDSIIGGTFAERDLHLKASYASSPPCIRVLRPLTKRAIRPLLLFYQKSPISCRKSLVFCRKSPIKALKLIKKSPTFSHIFQPKELYFVPKSPVFCPTYTARTHNHRLSMTLSLTHSFCILTPCKSPTASQKESCTALLVFQPKEPRIPPKA